MKDFIAPLKVISKEKKVFVVWFLFAVIIGQIVTIFNFFRRCLFNSINFKQNFLADSLSGNFYVYSLALVTSSMGAVIIDIMNKKKYEHRQTKGVAITVYAIICMFLIYIYSLATDENVKNIIDVNINMIKFDLCQLIFFVLSILISMYTFCLTRFSDYDEFKIYDDDYRRREDERKQKLLKNDVSSAGTIKL